MKFDRYTKSVLTIIAVCLVWICLKDVVLVPAAMAQARLSGRCEGVQAVKIVGISLPTRLGAHDSVFDQKALPVKVQNWPRVDRTEPLRPGP